MQRAKNKKKGMIDTLLVDAEGPDGGRNPLQQPPAQHNVAALTDEGCGCCGWVTSNPQTDTTPGTDGGFDPKKRAQQRFHK